MIVLLDLGNSSANYGFYERGRFLSTGFGPSSLTARKIRRGLSRAKEKPSHLVISSVVPSLTRQLIREFSGDPDLKIWVAGKNLPVPIRHRYRDIRKLGIDRAVNIFGACRIYRPPLLVFDFGTAVTADFISKEKIFQGGLIIPGPRAALEGLLRKASLLPKTSGIPLAVSGFPGRNTADCLRSGILEGYAAMTDGLILRFKEKFGKFRVLVTGGFSNRLTPLIRHPHLSDPLHSMKSLLILFKELRSRQ